MSSDYDFSDDDAEFYDDDDDMMSTRDDEGRAFQPRGDNSTHCQR